MKRSIIRSLFVSSVALTALLVAAPAALAVDEFVLPTPGAKPAGITAAPDGSIWFTEESTDVNQIGRVLGGGVTEFGGLFPAPPPAAGQPRETGPAEIAAAPDGALWFTENGAARVGRMTPGGAVTHECTLPSTSAPDGITRGPDNRMWFTLSGSNRIGRLDPLDPDPCGTISQFPPTSQPTPLNGPGDITPGPDNALWFTQSGGNKIGRIETSGSPITQPTNANDPSGITKSGASLWFTEFGGDRVVQISTTGFVTNTIQLAVGSRPSGITLGPDDALWFTETDANKIGRVSVAGNLTNEFTIPTPGSAPGDITAGPDGVWFTEFLGNKIGRIVTATGSGGTSTTPPPPPPPPPVTSTKKKCKVPKLRGLTAKKARSKLKRAKCKYKFRGKGRVRSTKPKAGRTTTGRVIVKFARRKASRR